MATTEGCDDVQLVNSQWRHFIYGLVRASRNAVMKPLDCGFMMAWSHSAEVLANAFFPSIPIEDEGDLLRRMAELKEVAVSANPKYDWVVVIEPEMVAEDIMPQLADIMAKAGFSLARTIVCMSTPSLAPPVRELPVADVRLAQTERDIRDALEINTTVYQSPVSDADNCFEEHTYYDPKDAVTSNLYVDGKLASTACVALLPDSLYVNFVATDGEHRNKGYCELVMRHAIAHAEQRVPHTKCGLVLHASPSGLPVYRRLGFTEKSRVLIFQLDAAHH